MPRTDGRLTPQEQRLAVLAAGGVELSEAARQAGYTTLNGARLATQRPAVQAEILAQQAKLIVEVAYPKAVDRVIKVLSDDRHQASAHIQAAKLVREWVKELTGDTTDKPLETMTAAELEAMRDKLMAQFADKAKAVDVEVVDEPEGGVFD